MVSIKLVDPPSLHPTSVPLIMLVVSLKLTERVDVVLFTKEEISPGIPVWSLPMSTGIKYVYRIIPFPLHLKPVVSFRVQVNTIMSPEHGFS